MQMEFPSFRKGSCSCARSFCRRLRTAKPATCTFVAAVIMALAGSAGAQFLPPGVVNPYSDVDLGTDRYPSHVIAPDGTIHVVWASTNPYAAPTGWDPDIYYSRLENGAWTFPEYVNPWAEADTEVDDAPRISLGADGVVHVVWQSQHDGGTWGTDWDVFHRALDPSSGWGTAEAINSDATTDNLNSNADDTLPNLMVRLDGSVLMTYQSEYGTGNSQLRWRVLDGSVWSSDLVRESSSLGPGSLALTEDGDVVAAWERVELPSQNHIIVTSTYGVAGGWTTVGEITSATANHIQPQVTAVGSGSDLEIHYVWATNDATGGIGTDYDLKHFVKLSRYPWSYGPFTVNSTADDDGSADDLRPSLCVEPGNILHVAWQSTVDLLTGTDLDVYHADNGSPGGEWSGIGLLGLNAPFDGPGEDDAYANLVCGPAHVLSGMWASTDDLGGTVGSDEDIFHALGVGRLYNRPRPVADWAISDNDFDGRARVVRHGLTTTVVWESSSSGGALSTGPDFDIYSVAIVDGVIDDVRLVNTSGTIDSGDDHDPDVAVDSSGHLHAVWSSTSDIGGAVGSDADIFYSVDTGAGWSTPELVHTSGTSDSIDDLGPRLAVDAAGVVHVLWYRRLSSIDGQLAYAQRTAGGWSAPEVPTVPTGTDWNPGSFDLDVTPGGEPQVVWNSWADHAGAGSDTDVFWSHRVSGVWTVAELVNDYGTSDSSPEDTPRVACASDGEVYALWSTSYDPVGGGTDMDLWLAKKELTGSKAASTWQPSVMLLSGFGTDVGNDLAPDLVVGSENIDVAWESDSPLLFNAAGSDFDIFHVSVPRTSSWPAEIGVGVANPNAFGDSGDDGGVSLAVAPGGAVFFAWHTDDTLGIGLGADLDVLLGQLGEPSGEIFSDGFESGNTLMWSSTVG